MTDELSERNAEIARLRSRGTKMRIIADMFGITKQRVQQIVDTQPWVKEHLRTQANERAREAFVAVLAKTMEAGRKCIVCKAWLPFSWPVQRVTCGGRCSSAYFGGLQYHLNPRFRLRQTFATCRWMVTNPEKVNATQLRWAQKVLDGEVDVQAIPHGRWTIKGSRTDQLREEFGIDLKQVGA